MFTPAAAAIPTTTAMPAAIPATTVAAPMPAMTAAPSFVAPPMMPAAGMPQFTTPAPVSLTAGLPDPKKLEAEKDAYEKALAAQLDKQSKAVLEEAKIKKSMLQQACQTQIAQYTIQAEEQCKMACLTVEKEAATVINGLKEAAILQQTTLEERAAVAAAEYNKKRAIEEMNAKSYAIQKQWFEGEAKLMHDYNKVMQKGARAMPATTPAVTTVPAGYTV